MFVPHRHATKAKESRRRRRPPAKFTFDLNELSKSFTAKSASDPRDMDKLFGRTVNSHAAPFGGLAFSEKFHAPLHDVPSTSTSNNIPSDESHHPEIDGHLDVDWDNYFRTEEPPPSSSDSDDEAETEDHWDDNAREGFAASFDLDDIEQQEVDDVADSEPNEDVTEVKVRRRDCPYRPYTDYFATSSSRRLTSFGNNARTSSTDSFSWMGPWMPSSSAAVVPMLRTDALCASAIANIAWGAFSTRMLRSLTISLRYIHRKKTCIPVAS